MIDLLDHVRGLMKEASAPDELELEALAELELEKRGFFDRFRGGRRKHHYLFGKRVAEEDVRNIEEALEKKGPKTETEAKVHQLVGAKPTGGQLTRWGLLGAGAGVGTHIGGAALEGGQKWLPPTDGGVRGLLKPTKAVLGPRNLVRAGAVGAAFAAGVPVARKLWDIRTARENPEAF